MPSLKKRKKQHRKQRTTHRASGSKKQLKIAEAGDWFKKLVEVQARLRAPDGCPWDREQTHQTLRTYLIEESYEVLDALESGDDAKFAEELGDLLLQILFHSQIAREERRFTITNVIREIHDKMIRRHPHVFGKTRAKNTAEVLKNWERIKAEERLAKGTDKNGNTEKGAKKNSLLDGISRGLPATLEGFQLTRRAARIGFDWENTAGIFEKLEEEAAELRHELPAKQQGKEKIEEEVGDLLFTVINLARFLEVDPEIALKRANAKFSTRFRTMEQLAQEQGHTLQDVPRIEMEAFWETAKRSTTSESNSDGSGENTTSDEIRPRSSSAKS